MHTAAYVHGLDVDLVEAGNRSRYISIRVTRCHFVADHGADLDGLPNETSMTVSVSLKRLFCCINVQFLHLGNRFSLSTITFAIGRRVAALVPY